MAQVQIQPSAQDPLAAQNDRNREAQFRLLQQIAPLPPGNAFPLTGVLGRGSYRGAVMLAYVDVFGINHPIVTGQVTFRSTGIVRGVEFQEVVQIDATGDVTFSECRFLSAINVDSGGKVACTACRFDGVSAIINAGAAPSAASTGCTKTSAVAHVNATVTAEVT